MFAKEFGLKGQAENSANANLACAVEQGFDQEVSDALAAHRVINHNRANLGEILPHNVKSTGGKHSVVFVDHNRELLDFLEKPN